jgi:hypothetical protein
MRTGTFACVITALLTDSVGTIEGLVMRHTTSPRYAPGAVTVLVVDPLPVFVEPFDWVGLLASTRESPMSVLALGMIAFADSWWQSWLPADAAVSAEEAETCEPRPPWT